MSRRPTPSLKEQDALIRLALARTRGGSSTSGLLPLFVDPQNVTGTASNANSGQTGTSAILTTNEFNRRLLAGAFQIQGPPPTVTYLSDDTSGTFLDVQALIVATAGVPVNFQGTPQIELPSGGTLNAGTTAINPAAAGGGQQQTAHATNVADWGPFISNFEINGFGSAPHPTYVLDLSGGNNGTSAWIAGDGGGDAPHTPATADLGRPVTAALGAGALTSGDSFRIQRGSLLALAGGSSFSGASLYSFSGPIPSLSPIVSFTDFAFTLPSVGVNGCSYQRCSFENEITVGGVYQHCFFSSDIIEIGGLPTSAIVLGSGVVYTFGTSRWSAPLIMTGDTYFTGASLLLGSAFGFSRPSVLPGIGSGVCVNRNSGGTGITVGSGEFDLGSTQSIGIAALVWGRQNVRGWVIGCNASVTASHSEPPTVTGNTSDYEFRQAGGGVRTQVARAFDQSVGQYTENGGPATRATTYTNLLGTIGAGGFAGGAHEPQANGHFVLAG